MSLVCIIGYCCSHENGRLSLVNTKILYTNKFTVASHRGGGGGGGAVAILLGLVHANKTGISSDRGLGLWLVCAFTSFVFYESGDPPERNCEEHSKSVARFLRLMAAFVSFIKETTTNKLSISDYRVFFPLSQQVLFPFFKSRVNYVILSFPLISFSQKSLFTKFSLVGSNPR